MFTKQAPFQGAFFVRNRTMNFGAKWSEMKKNAKPDHLFRGEMVRNEEKRETGPFISEPYGPKWEKV